MAQYKTIRNFWDVELKTSEYPKGKLYKKGEVYPAEGIEVSEERLHELSTYSNRAGEIFIEVVEEKENSETTENEVVEDKPKRGRKRKED